MLQHPHLQYCIHSYLDAIVKLQQLTRLMGCTCSILIFEIVECKRAALVKDFQWSGCFLDQILTLRDLLLQPFVHSFPSKAILHQPFQGFNRTLLTAALFITVLKIANKAQGFTESFAWFVLLQSVVLQPSFSSSLFQQSLVV